MAIQKISIQDFVDFSEDYLLLDVRSPGEYSHARIPGAISLPLFSNEERAIVGTTYKKQSREKAIKIGLQFFGPNMLSIVEKVEAMLPSIKATKIIVHCWRGGMRSAAIAWLLDLYGFQVSTIVGGYKSYRRWVLEQFEKTYQMKVIGGYTGSGKTEILRELKKQQQTVIDLEALASHKGSAFGSLGESEQCSQEMFENVLALQLYRNKDTCIWVEDESRRIGNLNLPMKFYQNKLESLIYFLDIPFEQRLQYIVSCYGKFEINDLEEAILRIKKRLGGLDTQNAVEFLTTGDIQACFRILLKYYDKCYLKGLNQRDNLSAQLIKVPCDTVESKENASKILEKEITQLKNTHSNTTIL